MHVTALSVTDFRSWPQADLELGPGVTALVGPNGQGKTNLVEAIGYVATLSSHRVASDTALVRAGAPRAIVRLRAARDDRSTLVELELNPGKANRAQVNRSPVRRPRDVLGILRTVLFAPEDLALVKGDPDTRRRFLDELAVQVAPRMAGVLADHDRVLRQRGALLKSAATARRARTQPDLRTLDVWDARLADLGAEVLVMRVALVEALAPHVQAAYAQVSDAPGDAILGYRSTLVEGAKDGEEAAGDLAGGLPHLGSSVAELSDQLREAMARVRDKEIDRGVTLVGPHRDDLVLTLGGLPAKGYASHGESWSFALALRLASWSLLTHGSPEATSLALAGWDEGSEPVLILDDVFAELDTRRRGRLAELVAGAEQVIVTAAVPADVPEQLEGVRLDVVDGTIGER
ncbi:DNA replication/repair protein RecF [Actinotalea sp. M2MS4P-6]|uniref:DNA replication/repair protein RecF n=1 Tax=Actinotalea sp. M2MS4P-6 TaxID=2983762 RepID=UPI0021E40E78|nr:DNA replication/repair protein RecF [Actinotalea sp. M2MS4P-6]MCV2392838.1 DNA replication/repair protein RecF [Actinotalea sp. M2MS4P-6]